MLTYKRTLFILIAFFAITLSIGIITFASSKKVVVRTSDGREVTLTSQSQAFGEWDAYEGYLESSRTDLDRLMIELDIINKGIYGDKSGLKEIITGMVIAGVSKRIDATSYAIYILKMLEGGSTFDMQLEAIDKYVSMYYKNGEIASYYSDRDKFWSALAEFEGSYRDKQVKGSLGSMQAYIPDLSVECGGGCGDAYYSYHNAASVSGAMPVDPYLLTSLAKEHQSSCAGCYETYWTCRPGDVKKHEVLYCSKDVVYGTLFNKTVIGVCGNPYRRCDDPKKEKVHWWKPEYAYRVLYDGRYVYYIKSYTGDPTNCGKGETTPPPGSVFGPMGVGIHKDIDKTPNCYSCIDGSPFCPQAATHH